MKKIFGLAATGALLTALLTASMVAPAAAAGPMCMIRISWVCI